VAELSIMVVYLSDAQAEMTDSQIVA